MTCGVVTRCGCVIAPCVRPKGHEGEHWQHILKDGRGYGVGGQELTAEEHAWWRRVKP